MSTLVNMGVAGVIGFAATTGASAHTIAEAMDQPDLLMLSETPLELSELSEARGGFKFGGFDFQFGVQISPVVIAPIGDVFPDGVFGDSASAASGGDDVLGESGIFGESGVFGTDGVFGQNGQSQGSPSPSGQAVVVVGNNPGASTPTPVQQIAEALPTTNALAAQQAVTSTPTPSVQQVAETLPTNAPAQQAVTSTVTFTPSVAPAAPSSTQAQSSVAPTVSLDAAVTPSTGAALSAATPVVTLAAAITTPAEQVVVSEPIVSAPAVDVVVQDAPSLQQTGNAGSAAPDTFVPTPTSKVSGDLAPKLKTVLTVDANANVEQAAASSVVGALNTVYSNSRNNVQFRKVVNIDVVVSNFDARITRAVGDSVTTSITSTYGLLSRF